MKRYWWMAAAVLVAACSDDGSSRPVEICVRSYSLAQYRDGDGPWVTATPDARGAHTLNVRDDFEFLGVIDSASFAYVTLWRSTVREWNEQRAGANADAELTCPPATPSGVAVTGMLAQSGIISLDGVSKQVSNGVFSFYVEPGTYDLVASSLAPGAGKVVIQRDITINGETMLPTIDIAQGVDVMARPIQVSNASQTPFWTTYLLVDGGVSFAEISSRSDGLVDVVPESVLESSDEQWIYVYAPDSGAEIHYKGSVPAVALLPPLAGVTFDIFVPTPSASWSTLPVDYNHIAMKIRSETPDDRLAYHDYYASRGWNETYAATSLGIEGPIPGFENKWTVNFFTLTHVSATVYMPARDNVTLWTQARP